MIHAERKYFTLVLLMLHLSVIFIYLFYFNTGIVMNVYFCLTKQFSSIFFLFNDFSQRFYVDALEFCDANSIMMSKLLTQAELKWTIHSLNKEIVFNKDRMSIHLYILTKSLDYFRVFSPIFQGFFLKQCHLQ